MQNNHTPSQAEALAAYEAELERREAAAASAMAEATAAAEAAREEMARAHTAVLGGVQEEAAKRKEQLEAAGITAISATMRRMVSVQPRQCTAELPFLLRPYLLDVLLIVKPL